MVPQLHPFFFFFKKKKEKGGNEVFTRGAGTQHSMARAAADASSARWAVSRYHIWDLLLIKIAVSC